MVRRTYVENCLSTVVSGRNVRQLRVRVSSASVVAPRELTLSDADAELLAQLCLADEARLDTPLKTEDHCICILTISL